MGNACPCPGPFRLPRFTRLQNDFTTVELRLVSVYSSHDGIAVVTVIIIVMDVPGKLEFNNHPAFDFHNDNDD